jgi:hypothetical protein
MMIHEEICVGCGRCQPYCPTAAIRYDGLKSMIDQEICYECSTCLRAAHCPVDAIAESPNVYDYPRALRRFFSDPSATHAATGIQGRGTEESKTNDVTLRVGPGEVGVAIETHNPIHSMIADEASGDLKPEMLGERVLSAIIEINVKRDELRGILRTLKEVAKEVDSVFCIDACTIVEPGLKIPEEVLESIRAEGFTWRPNAKINMGLGRAWE